MGDNTATATVEDITEVSWEDLALEMSDEANPDHVVSTTGGSAMTLHSCAGSDCHFG